MEHVINNQWPKDGKCLFGPWYQRTGLPKPSQYRVCVHPRCDKVEVRESPRA